MNEYEVNTGLLLVFDENYGPVFNVLCEYGKIMRTLHLVQEETLTIPQGIEKALCVNLPHTARHPD